MICPRCNSPSVEGKKYCADCGTALDPQGKQLELLVKSQVEKTIQERFRDQKLIDVETSQAVAERLMAWAKLLGFFIGMPLVVLVIILSVSGIEKYSDFKNKINNIERQVEPQIARAKSDAEQAQKTAAEAKDEATSSKQTIQAATADTLKQLAAATELEQRTSQQIQGSSQKVDTRMSELDQKMDTAIKDIADQQKKLESTDELVKTLFSKGTTEFFVTTANGPNVVTVPLKKGALVFMLLKSAPIYQTIEVKWRVFSQPHGSYFITNNVLFFNWGDPAENLKQYPLEVTYVPDPTAKAPAFKALSVKDNAVFADETKIMDLPPNQ
jgi:hypothetical protein